MKPAPPLIRTLTVVTLTGTVVVAWPPLLPAWLAAMGGAAAVAMIDAILLWRRSAPRASRRVGPSLALGLSKKVTLRIDNPGRRDIRADVFDHYPDSMHISGQPVRVRVPAAGFHTLTYSITPLERGPQQFGAIDLREYSPLSWWTRRTLIDAASSVNVFPNFAAVTKYAVLGVDAQAATSGLHLRPRRGEGSEFHQLREYRVGDTFRQIDWKATARLSKLIAKEYQEERDQQIVFLVDSGRRMLTREDGLSHFDQVLNAMLLLSYVALRQGDAVGFLTCNEPSRWMKPRKGMSTLSLLTRRLFDLQPEAVATDYQAAATQLAVLQKRRALVVLLTNIRDEDSDDLRAAFGLLRRRHVVLVASLREPGIDQLLARPIDDFDGARDFASAHHYLDSRRATHEKLKSRGVLIEDTSCKDLPRAIARRYMDIKRAGVL